MSHKKRLLLVEDEEDIAALIKLHAETLGYKLDIEIDGQQGLRTLEREKPDLVILDIMLPKQSGLDICRKVKSRPDLKKIPIILLTAKTEESDIVAGLDLGADDYVVKPFSAKVLFSRIKAVLRRAQANPKPLKAMSFGEFIVDVEHYSVKRDNESVLMTLSEFEILKRLLVHRGKVLTRNQLLEGIQSDNAFVVDRNIDVHVASLRKKLGPGFHWIETVRGVGYRFKE